MQTERVTILMTPAKKAELAARAAAHRMSIGQYVRRKVEEEDEQLTPEQEAELALLVAQANQAIPAMVASLDKMIETVRATSVDIRNTLDQLSTRS
ncbi:hypothetical protein GGQ80_001674 [Sphingomonas jinjuensis]|uniref:Uncharacterized protein n=1 Tax=Sphingomonas jinjuensis TaxID=535907 RepID=A0A840FII6_9SPHN|nr:hypothetical protein [Sphingomonas jinjuensis]MBB4153768.1 hypothetical protein [Sphingomonas jinjuensis]